MARLFNGSTDFGLSNAAVNLSAFKAFARAFFIQFTGTPAGEIAICNSTKAGAGALYSQIHASEVDVFFQTSAGTHVGVTAGLAAFVPGTWYLIGYNIDATASYFVRNIWVGKVGGGNPVDYLNSSTGDATPTFGANDTVRFGKPDSLDSTGAFPGSLARIGGWAAASGSILTQANMNAMVTGTDPLTIQPGSLMHDWPFLGTSNPEPDSGASPITIAITGASEVADPVFARPGFIGSLYPGNPMMGGGGSSGGGSAVM